VSSFVGASGAVGLIAHDRIGSFLKWSARAPSRMLSQYKVWADKVIFDSVAALPWGEAEKERKTLFKTIIGGVFLLEGLR
jgi:hypothetical protein